MHLMNKLRTPKLDKIHTQKKKQEVIIGNIPFGKTSEEKDQVFFICITFLNARFEAYRNC